MDAVREMKIKKKKLGVLRWMILDHKQNTARG
jgi:hypothetical protein